MPIVAEAGPMPTHQRLGTDDREDLQDRWKPAIHLDKEPAIVVREPGSAAPQNDQLMSKRRRCCSLANRTRSPPLASQKSVFSLPLRE